MAKYLYYIITVVAAALMFGIYFLFFKKKQDKIKLVGKILSWVLFALMFVWLLLTKGGYITNTLKLGVDSLYSPFKSTTTLLGTEATTLFVLFSIWGMVIIHITAMLAPYFEFRVIHLMERLVSPILATLCFIFLPETIFGYLMTYDITAMGILYSTELGLIIGKMIYQVCFDRISVKMNKSEVLEFVLCVAGAVLFTLPDYMIVAIFGNPHFVAPTLDFGTGHRYYIYATIIFIVGLTLILRNRKGEYSRMIMLFIGLGGMISFSTGYSFKVFIEPYNWPLHICNTAMFILPLALVTKNEKIFYFTFFINILGALLAILMPNYSSAHLFSARIIEFFTNHIFAMGGPLVCVLLGIFNRPRKRQFFYSMVGFAIYYVLVLVCNTVFSAIWPQYETDYFYINSDFIASKVHAEFLLDNFAFHFTINGKNFTMYPLYQVIYFSGFIGMSVGMWYVYVWLFKLQDTLIYLNERSKKIKFDELALTQKCGEKEVSTCMNPESVDKLVISNFGKRYTETSPFAVRNVNFEAHAGEIIGFLGPNGAGKSTTIKAIVGIHLPTEGKIEVNGYDVAVQPVQAKAQLGFVPDHYALYENLTGREYLNYIADLYNVTEEDRNSFLDEFLVTLAMKDAIDNKIQTYSHGMKQKIAIMASIIHNPKLWILDEPLTGLDPVSIYQVKMCLKKHAEKGNIVFFSSHLIDIVEKLCDRIIIISNHQVVDISNVKELASEHIDLEKYYMEKTGLATGN